MLLSHGLTTFSLSDVTSIFAEGRERSETADTSLRRLTVAVRIRISITIQVFFTEKRI